MGAWDGGALGRWECRVGVIGVRWDLGWGHWGLMGAWDGGHWGGGIEGWSHWGLIGAWVGGHWGSGMKDWGHWGSGIMGWGALGSDGTMGGGPVGPKDGVTGV